jgi:hypothetical protein
MSFVDREIRRRCMWACFVMDRFTSSGTERPCLISESEIEIQLPSHDRNLELDIPTVTERLDGTVNVRDVKGLVLGESNIVDNMGVGAYIVRVVSLYGRVAKYFNQVSIMFPRFLPIFATISSTFALELIPIGEVMRFDTMSLEKYITYHAHRTNFRFYRNIMDLPPPPP